MEKARYNTEPFPNLSQPLNNVKPSNFWGSHQKRGYREQFSCKNALDRPSQGMSVREIPWFYGRSRKNDSPIRKMAGFYGRLKETCPKQPIRWCNRGAKRKMQMLGFMHMHKHRLKRRISAASSASARLSQKVAAAGTPDPTIGSGRYAPERGCHEVTGVRK